MAAGRTGRLMTSALLGVLSGAPAGVLAQPAVASALNEPLALPFTVTASCPTRLEFAARAGMAQATASTVAPAGTVVA